MDHPVVAVVTFISVLLLFFIVVQHYLRRSRLPVVCWLLVAGIAYGLVKKYAALGLPDLQLHPDVVLYVMLPLLIFDAARKLRFPELKSVAVEAGLLATVGVVVSMFLFGLPIAVAASLPVGHALLLGAILAATDPVAVTAVLARFTFPERLRTFIESESLLNDGSTVVLYALLTGIVLRNDVPGFGSLLLEFAVSMGGAAAIGAAGGSLCAKLLIVWHETANRFIVALLPLVAVYLIFVVVQYVLDWSGVVAVMAAALAINRTYCHERCGSETDDTVRVVHEQWDFLADLVNAFLFFVLGVEMGGHFYAAQWALLPVVVGLLYASRAVLVYASCFFFNKTLPRIPPAWQHVLNLAGLRGALCVALILMLPADYAYRSSFLCIAFVVIAVTMIVNPLVLVAYLKRVKLTDRAKTGRT